MGRGRGGQQIAEREIEPLQHSGVGPEGGGQTDEGGYAESKGGWGGTTDNVERLEGLCRAEKGSKPLAWGGGRDYLKVA